MNALKIEKEDLDWEIEQINSEKKEIEELNELRISNMKEHHKSYV